MNGNLPLTVKILLCAQTDVRFLCFHVVSRFIRKCRYQHDKKSGQGKFTTQPRSIIQKIRNLDLCEKIIQPKATRAFRKCYINYELINPIVFTLHLIYCMLDSRLLCITLLHLPPTKRIQCV
jgi:hypothetical protein